MTLTKLGLIAAASILIVSSISHAADLSGSLKDEPQETAYRRFSWSGAYGGVHLGGGWGNANIKERLPDLGGVLPSSISSEHDVDGVIGGVHLGMNKQFGHIVVGAEVRLSGSGISGRTRDCFGLTSLALGAVTAECDSSVNWLASAMAKVGYAWNRWLVYGNAGWAVAGIDHRATISIDPLLLPLAISSAVNETADGFAFGGGVEFAATDSILVGVEYTRTQLKADGSGLLFGGILTTGSRDIDLNELKARLSIKFGG